MQHSKVRNEHGRWERQVETVCKRINSTPWSLKDGSSVVLPVIDARNADDLHLPLAGKKVYLLCKCNTLARGPAAVCLIAHSLLHVSSISLCTSFQQMLPKNKSHTLCCRKETCLALRNILHVLCGHLNILFAESPLPQQQVGVFSLSACPVAFALFKYKCIGWYAFSTKCG